MSEHLADLARSGGMRSRRSVVRTLERHVSALSPVQAKRIDNFAVFEFLGPLLGIGVMTTP